MQENEDDSSHSRMKPFFEFTLANVVQIGLILLGMVASYYRFDNRLENSENNLVAVNKRLDLFESYIKKLDVEGTNSKIAATSDTKTIDQHTAQLNKLEDVTARNNSILIRLDNNMDWMSGWIKKQMDQPSTIKSH